MEDRKARLATILHNHRRDYSIIPAYRLVRRQGSLPI